MPNSISCYLNVGFIHSTILDCLPAFQIINENETLIVDKLFCFQILQVLISGLLAIEGDMLLILLKCTILSYSNRFNFGNNIYLAFSGLSLNILASKKNVLECKVGLIRPPRCVVGVGG